MKSSAGWQQIPSSEMQPHRTAFPINRYGHARSKKEREMKNRIKVIGCSESEPVERTILAIDFTSAKRHNPHDRSFCEIRRVHVQNDANHLMSPAQYPHTPFTSASEPPVGKHRRHPIEKTVVPAFARAIPFPPFLSFFSIRRSLRRRYSRTFMRRKHRDEQ